MAWLYDHAHPSHVTIRGHRFHLDKRDSLRLWLYRQWEPSVTEAIQEFVKPDWVCADVGAHIGYHTIEMANLAECVLAFEPELSNFICLGDNILASNYVGKVWAFREIVSDVNVSLRLLEDPYSSGGHRVSYVGGLETPTIRLDHRLTKIDLLKIDVEGHECYVLDGLGSHKPEIIIVEASQANLVRAGSSVQDLWDRLQPSYDIYRLRDTEGPRRCKLTGPVIFGYDYNWLCIRRP